jgi:hypothetical protein
MSDRERRLMGSRGHTACPGRSLLAIVVPVLAIMPAGISAELKGRDVVVTATERGSGLLDAMSFKGRGVLKAEPGFPCATISLVQTGTPDAVPGNTLSATLNAELTSIAEEPGRLVERGVYTDGKVRVPFSREIALSSESNAITVREVTDFAAVPAGMMVAEHRLALPPVVCADEHLRMLALGGARRAELFRMDMNDVTHNQQYISAPRGHQPYWDIGAVLQEPEGYQLWKANHADTPVYPLEDGEGAPGWADYSELDWGVTAQVIDPLKSAPWQMLIDAGKGLFVIQPYPPSELPASGSALGRRELAFTLTLHESSWPVTRPCELDFELYKRFLDWLNTPNARWTPLNIVVNWGIGDAIPDGTRTPEEMEDVYRRVIFKERMQPSVLLRLLYRGDAYLMQGYMRDVVGKSTPRNQSMDEWEKCAREFFDKIRRDGFPPRKPM